MRTPFYETDFDVKEYISKRILEMESLSDRVLYKEMAENLMLPLFELQREQNRILTETILQQAESREPKHDLYIGVVEKSKYDGTDRFLTPIIAEDKEKTDVSKITGAISTGVPYLLGNIYIREPYPNIEKIQEKEVFHGVIKTTQGEYEATFRISSDDRYLQKTKVLFQAFCHNGIRWNTLCMAHLIRMCSVSVTAVKSDHINGEFTGYEIDFGGYNVIKDMMPLWNVWEAREKTSAFPIAVNGGLKFEHTVLLKQFKKNSRLIIGSTDVEIYSVTANDSSLSITCSENIPREWLFYELHNKEKQEEYTYPLLSNLSRSSLADTIQKEHQSRISTKSEVLKIAGQSPFYPRASLMNIDILNGYRSKKQNYSMFDFLVNEDANHEDKKVLLLTFQPRDPEDYLIYDYISHMATMVQEHIPHYHCVAEIEV